MNKVLGIIGAAALLLGGYYIGQSKAPEPTVIKVSAEPSQAFTSSGAEEVQAAATGAAVRSLATPTSGELIVVKDGESIQDAVKQASETELPGLETIFSDVYEEIPQHIRTQGEEAFDLAAQDLARCVARQVAGRDEFVERVDRRRGRRLIDRRTPTDRRILQ